jgi:hypothetical protein
MLAIWAFRIASSSMLLLDAQSLTLRVIQVAAILELLVRTVQAHALTDHRLS